MGDPMTTVFGPQRCALCGADHYRGTRCPEPTRRAVSFSVRTQGPERLFVAEPSGRCVSPEAEAAFLVWESRARFAWDSPKQREGAITAFSAGWIAAEDNAGREALNQAEGGRK